MRGEDYMLKKKKESKNNNNNNNNKSVGPRKPPTKKLTTQISFEGIFAMKFQRLGIKFASFCRF